MHDLWQIQYSFLIPLLPLLGACVAGFFGARWLKQQSHWPIWIGVGGSAVISVSLLIAMLGMWHPHGAQGAEHAEHTTAGRYPLATSIDLFNWISIGDFNATAGFLFDPLTAVMLCVVTGIGFFITVFAKGYMAGDRGYFRFFAYLGLFIFAMTILVMGNNLIMLYLGWEGVGLCSYLLIGHYYEKPSAREAAKKAFLVNRVGDFGFGIGIMLCFAAFGTTSYFGAAPDATPDGILEMSRLATITSDQHHALRWIPFLLMIGAFGKSAQFPLHVWLPDAMEGPTPVSALIHAATMVTAGVYMIARCGTLFVANEAAMTTVTAIGAFTALFAATIALRQFDLKKVFAYSTVSQLGFMFVGVGCLAPVSGVFHLVTHAFFKALLFLSSGVVMHAMAGELDMRRMSGLGRVLPRTRILMLIGCLALAGVPLFSGFFSKDEIIAAAWNQSRLLALVMLVTAFLTAYYTFKLYFRVFAGPQIIPPPPAGAHGHAEEEHDLAVKPPRVSAGLAGPSTPSAALHGKTDVDEHLARPAHQQGHGHGHDGHDEHHNHEPLSMILPLVVLAIGAVCAGYLNWPERHESLGAFLGSSPSLEQSYHLAAADIGGPHPQPIPFGQVNEPEDAAQVEYQHGLHRTLMIVSGLVSLLGIYFAYLLHLKDRAAAERLAAGAGPLTRVIENRYWVDEIYQAGIVEPLRSAGRAFFLIDRFVVDGLVWAISFVPQLSGFALKLTTQRGYLQGYAAVMLLGIAVILMVILL